MTNLAPIASSGGALGALAAAGHGLTVVPASALAGEPGITTVPLSAPPLVHRTELVHGTLASPAATALAAALASSASPP